MIMWCPNVAMTPCDADTLGLVVLEQMHPCFTEAPCVVLDYVLSLAIFRVSWIPCQGQV